MSIQNNNTRVAILRDKSQRDVFWTMSFTENHLEELLDDPAGFILGRCHPTGNTKKVSQSYTGLDPTTGISGNTVTLPLVFLDRLPVTIQFVYSTPISQEEELTKNLYLATGISGTNHITIHCPQPDIIDWDELSLQRSIKSEINDVIGSTYNFDISPILFDDSSIGFIHYEIKGLKEENLLKLTTSFIKNPGLIAAYFNYSQVENKQLIIGQGDSKQAPTRRIRFKMPDEKRLYNFRFMYETKPKTVDNNSPWPPKKIDESWLSSNTGDASKIEQADNTKQSDNNALPSLSTQGLVAFTESDCMKFICTIHDDPQIGIIFMVLEDGTQIRWLPAPIELTEATAS